MPLDLFFLRHAVAVERGCDGFAEDERPLTEVGREKMILEVRGLKKWGLGFEVLFSSPLTRALQTAELVKHYLPFKGSIEVENELRPGGSLKALLKKMEGRKEQSFLLVGHEPMLSSWIQNLLGCGRSAGLRLKKGALCHLILDQPDEAAATQLAALLQPRALRLMGRKAG